MAKYTTQVRSICEHYAGLDESADYTDVSDIIAAARPKIFSFDYPIFDSSYKAGLETKILKHYYTREIGLETVGLWKLKLDTKMNEIMPYYNQLYSSALIEFNPMHDTDISTTEDRTGHINDDGERNELGVENNHTTAVHDKGTTDTNTETGSITGTENGTETTTDKTDTWSEFSDTPQGGLNGIKDHTYLTNATHAYDDPEAGSTSTKSFNGRSHVTDFNSHANTLVHSGQDVDTTDSSRSFVDRKTENNNDRWITDNFVRHIAGKSSGASYSKLLNEFRETFLNIDMLVIEELSDLFLNLW